MSETDLQYHMTLQIRCVRLENRLSYPLRSSFLCHKNKCNFMQPGVKIRRTEVRATDSHDRIPQSLIRSREPPATYHCMNRPQRKIQTDNLLLHRIVNPHSRCAYQLSRLSSHRRDAFRNPTSRRPAALRSHGYGSRHAAILM